MNIEVQLRHVRCSWGFEDNDEIVPVTDFNTTIQSGGIYLITGDNGAGKTTLLKALLGGVPFVTGVAQVRETNLEPETIPVAELCKRYFRPFYMPQRVQEMFPEHTCVATVLREWAKVGVEHMGRQSTHEVLETLQLHQVFEALKWRHCEYLSGGQAQLLGLSMLFLSRADFALLDEPSSSISRENKERVAELMQSL